MSTLESNLALISSIPEDKQEIIHTFLIDNFCIDNPFKPMSAQEIYDDLAVSREQYANGQAIDFDSAIEEISKKYGL